MEINISKNTTLYMFDKSQNLTNISTPIVHRDNQKNKNIAAIIQIN